MSTLAAGFPSRPGTGALARNKQKAPSALIVEDNEHVVYLLEFMLDREGFRTTTCVDGREASDFIESNDPVDVVLLDLVLPYRDGFEILRQIRDDERWAAVPVIVLSARTMERDVVRGLEAGANDYVGKPYNPRELLARVKRHMRHDGAART